MRIQWILTFGNLGKIGNLNPLQMQNIVGHVQLGRALRDIDTLRCLAAEIGGITSPDELSQEALLLTIKH